uniref:PepSY domain-containing protein n=1 Tax=Mycobacterium sp. (strain JLS) TaxID=164757 RepID=A0A5Q5CK05_MYCSJ
MREMTKFAATTLFAGAAATAFFGLAAPAQAAPAGPGNAQNTIEQLDDRGYAVRVNHQGMVKPLDESSIVAVRYDNDDRVVYVTVR